MSTNNDQIQTQITNSILNGPHVVIVGAGATIAALEPTKGDKNGRKSSAMEGLIKNLGLDDLLNDVILTTTSTNFEDIYSEISDNPKYKDVCQKIESSIYEYFDSLEIPDTPTAYDYLILSLRKKDWIFSFNWDSLLIQAYSRCYHVTSDLPELVFLHGNVNVAYCPKCKKPQRRDYRKCIQCGADLIPTPLLYPIKKKDYTSSEYINKAWEVFKVALNEASVLTVFGYSAPKSDEAAVGLMKSAFANRVRWYNQFEVIDIAAQDIIYDTWAAFIEAVHEHITIHKTLFDGTLMAEFPRRTIEGYAKRYYGGWWGTSAIQLRDCRSLSELFNLLRPLVEREEVGAYSVV